MNTLTMFLTGEVGFAMLCMLALLGLAAALKRWPHLLLPDDD
jgi:hypothetical protein